MGGVAIQGSPHGRREGRKEEEHMQTTVQCWGAQQDCQGSPSQRHVDGSMSLGKRPILGALQDHHWVELACGL